jgi:hypothetical protein
LYETNDVIVSFPSNPMIGDTDAYCDCVNFNGDIAEVLLFNRVLTGDEKVTVGNYLMAKYNLFQYATNAIPPGTPTNLIATGVSPYQLNLQWARTSANEITFDIERKPGAGGTYQEIGNVAAGVTNFLDTTASPTNQNFYRVKARNNFGDSAYSLIISPPTVSLTNWPATILENTTNLIGAQAADADGTVNNVGFFAGSGLIGTATSAPYTVNWLATMEGAWSLVALATDNQGNSQYSEPVTVTVYLDSNGDGIPDFLQVEQGNDPLNPWVPPVGGTNNVPPNIYLYIPTNATLLP